MIDRLVALLTGREAPDPRSGEDALRVAVAALLVEAARMDGTFDAAERTAIERLLAERFDLPPADVHALVEAGEDAVVSSSQYFPFTHRITHALSEDERARIIEMMWTVALTDGDLDAHEDALLRQVASLIGISDRARSLARQRARAALGR